MYTVSERSWLQNLQTRDFPDSPVVKTLCFHFKEHGFNPWSGNLDPTNCTVWQKIKIKKPKLLLILSTKAEHASYNIKIG